MLRFFRQYVPASAAALLASEFILIYLCYVAATFAFLRFDAQVFLIDDNGWLRILIVAICLILGIYFHDLYSNLRVRLRDLIQHAGVVAGAAFLAEALLSYLKQPQLVVPAGPMIAGSGLIIVTLLGWRIFFQRRAPPDDAVGAGDLRREFSHRAGDRRPA